MHLFYLVIVVAKACKPKLIFMREYFLFLRKMRTAIKISYQNCILNEKRIAA